jgi:doublesex- and mab-3-related transcription factor 4/5
MLRVSLFFRVPGSKRPRMSTETDHDTGSESTPSSPRLKPMSFSMSKANMSPTRTGPPSSPESDLDVDSAPDEAAPENLCLKKEKSKSPPPSSLNGSNNNTVTGFLPYHLQQQQFQQAMGVNTSPSHRSPVDVLMR